MNQIATTREQSQRLILAGLKPETADMFWFCTAFEEEDPDAVWTLNVKQAYNPDEIHGAYPAWSLGALWNIFVESNTTLCFETDKTTPAFVLISMLVQNIVNALDGKVKLELNPKFIR